MKAYQDFTCSGFFMYARRPGWIACHFPRQNTKASKSIVNMNGANNAGVSESIIRMWAWLVSLATILPILAM